MQRPGPERRSVGRRLADATRAGSRLRPAHSPDETDRYFTLFATSPVPSLRLDANGVIQEVNGAALALLNASAAALVGHPLMVFVVPEDRSELLEHLRLT